MGLTQSSTAKCRGGSEVPQGRSRAPLRPKPLREIALEGHVAKGAIILTTFEDDQYVFDAIRAGASGFLVKTTPADELVDAIRVVAAGDAMLAPSVTRKLIEEFVRRSPVQTTTLADGTLTDGELEVLKLVARGLSNAEIAEKLFLSEATVKTHLGRVLSKLELRDRAQVVVFAYEAGIVRPGSV